MVLIGLDVGGGGAEEAADRAAGGERTGWERGSVSTDGERETSEWGRRENRSRHRQIGEHQRRTVNGGERARQT